MTTHTLTDLHALLDTVQSGDIITAAETLSMYDGSTVHTITNGPARVSGGHVSVGYTALRNLTRITPTITAVSVTTREEVTVTRDDEPAMHALLDGLTDGERITVEFRDGDEVTIYIGSVDVSRDDVDRDEVTVHHALGVDTVRWDDRDLSYALHSITATREVTKRWERKA